MSIKPAYHISLNAPQKRLIGELSAIQSQCEWLMQLATRRLLDTSMDTVRVIMGSTSLASNANIFIAVVREKSSDPETRAWAEYAYEQIDDLSRSRNDFLHTLYGVSPPEEDPNIPVLFAYGHRAGRIDKSPERQVGIRVRSHSVVPLSDLREIRDRAAYLTVVFAHIVWLVDPGRTDRSPWPRRLKSKLPPPSRRSPKPLRK